MNHYFLPVAAKKPTKTEQATTYPVRFPKPIYDAMTAICEEKERSINWLVNKVMERYLKEEGRLPEDHK